MQDLIKTRRNKVNLIYKYPRPLSVIYYGNIIQAPAGAKWIAIDSEGFLWAYRSKPLIDNRAKRYRANGEEEKVSPHLFSKIAKWQDTLCPVMDCQWMIDALCLIKYNGVTKDIVDKVTDKRGITRAQYEHFMTHAASLIDEDELEELREVMQPDKIVAGFLNVPGWAEWLCISSTGMVTVFESEPELDQGFWKTVGRLALVGRVDSYDNWAKSKMKL